MDFELAAVVRHMSAAIEAAAICAEPFLHLELAAVFPPAVYRAMLEHMPEPNDYRPMSGRTKYTRTEAGATRTKIDLFPEFIGHLPQAKRPVWGIVAGTLCATEVREALRRRLAAGLERRFGARYRSLGLYPIPTLTRDVPGYEIGIHPDTRSKAITVQLYLPRDRSLAHVGTVFHKATGRDGFERARQMSFAPNTGYAFAVGTETYHSVDKIGPEVGTRDSILLTYFLDDSALDRARNRVKRFGNLVRNELRHLAH
jgi:hypothetical protein